MVETVALGPRVLVQDVAEAHARLLAAFAGDGPVIIDCDTLEEGDFALVQLLLSARLQGERTGRDVQLASPAGPVLAGLLERAGLADIADTSFWFHGDHAA